MSFLKELRVTPRGARILAGIVYLGLSLLLWLGPIMQDHGLQQWHFARKLLLGSGVPLLPAIYILLVGYVYGDAKRRGMRHMLWMLLAIFVPYAIGIIFYFVLRDPLPVPCPSCGVLAMHSFVFCPRCGAALKCTCPHCGRASDMAWAHCAYCGTKLG